MTGVYPIYVGDESLKHFHNQDYHRGEEEIDIEGLFKNVDIKLFIEHFDRVKRGVKR